LSWACFFVAPFFYYLPFFVLVFIILAVALTVLVGLVLELKGGGGFEAGAVSGMALRGVLLL
jgi:hypothetical protein